MRRSPTFSHDCMIEFEHSLPSVNMSYAFEGVLCLAPFENFQSISSSISTPLKLKAEKINEYLSYLSRVEDNISWKFSSEIEYVASQISLSFSKALLIRYDDRVGYRESIVFQKGYSIKRFDLADEIWVMLDDGGEPIVNGKQFTIEQIEDDDDDEYETICNAIQLGLESIEINKNTWREIRSFITRPNWKK